MHPTPSARARRLTLAVMLAGVVIGCSNVVEAFGPSPWLARRAGDELLYSFAARFTNVQRDDKTARARSELARGALMPSRVFADSTVWTSGGDSTRILRFAGRRTSSGYSFAADRDAGLPEGLAHSRHVIGLRHIGGNDWMWQTHVEHAVGRVRVVDIPVVASALLASTENRDSRALRLGYRLGFPRTTGALGRAWTLDTLRALRDADGATTLHLVATLHPERLRATFPSLARYVERYNMPATIRVALVDATGARWADISSIRGVLTMRLRTRGGRLAPLTGVPRPMPDTLQLRASAQTRIMLFDVGFEDLVADLVLHSSPTERAFHLRFAREPEWRLPPVMGQLVGAPLRRPFAAGGATLDVSIMDGLTESQTLVVRDSRLVVRESAVLRWLGMLGGSAMSDFAGAAEREQNRFVAELFTALQADLRALPIEGPAR